MPSLIDRRGAPEDRLPVGAAFAALLAFAALALAAAGCEAERPAPAGGDGAASLRVVATTSIVADVVGQIGGERVAVRALVAPTSDAHAYVPTPRDLVAVTEADAVFASGLGLEVFLDDLSRGAGGPEPIRLSERAGGPPLSDPHVWLDVQAVIAWTEAIAAELARLDPAGAADYQAHAAAYRSELEALDASIAATIGAIPDERRAIAADHLAMGAFCARYGCRVVGAILPSPSSEGAPSPRHLADLADAMVRERVRVVVADRIGASPAARRLAAETGATFVALDIEGLPAAGNDGDGSYVAMMRANAEALAAALR